MKLQKTSGMIAAAVLVLSLAGCVSAGYAGTPAGTAARTTVSKTSAAITKAQAITIALEHAGLSETDVTGIWAEYDLDEGIPEYDVEFHAGHWEYSYDIHAETGEIRSFSRED